MGKVRHISTTKKGVERTYNEILETLTALKDVELNEADNSLRSRLAIEALDLHHVVFMVARK